MLELSSNAANELATVQASAFPYPADSNLPQMITHAFLSTIGARRR
jgi:hypothetical protein